MGPREWWITGWRTGDDESVSQTCIVDSLPNCGIGDQPKIHVVEKSARGDADLREVGALIEEMALALHWYWAHWGTENEKLKIRGYIVSKTALAAYQKWKGDT